jgi:hypothetical protein
MGVENSETCSSSRTGSAQHHRESAQQLPELALAIGNPMAVVIAVRATITEVKHGYTVTAVLEKNGRSLTLAEKTVKSRAEAETVARSFAALHEVPWHTVGVLYR